MIEMYLNLSPESHCFLLDVPLFVDQRSFIVKLRISNFGIIFFRCFLKLSDDMSHFQARGLGSGRFELQQMPSCRTQIRINNDRQVRTLTLDHRHHPSQSLSPFDTAQRFSFKVRTVSLAIMVRIRSLNPDCVTAKHDLPLQAH
jgi:hypothetical protein